MNIKERMFDEKFVNHKKLIYMVGGKISNKIMLTEFLNEENNSFKDQPILSDYIGVVLNK